MSSGSDISALYHEFTDALTESGSNGTVRRSTAVGLILRNPNLASLPLNASTAAIDEIAAWEHDRNVGHTKSDWHFTTKSARVKLKHATKPPKRCTVSATHF